MTYRQAFRILRHRKWMLSEYLFFALCGLFMLAMSLVFPAIWIDEIQKGYCTSTFMGSVVMAKIGEVLGLLFSLTVGTAMLGFGLLEASMALMGIGHSLAIHNPEMEAPDYEVGNMIYWDRCRDQKCERKPLHVQFPGHPA